MAHKGDTWKARPRGGVPWRRKGDLGRPRRRKLAVEASPHATRNLQLLRRSANHAETLANLHAEPFLKESANVFSSHVANSVWNEDFKHHTKATEMELETEVPGRIIRVDHTFKVAHKMQSSGFRLPDRCLGSCSASV